MNNPPNSQRSANDRALTGVEQRFIDALDALDVPAPQPAVAIEPGPLLAIAAAAKERYHAPAKRDGRTAQENRKKDRLRREDEIERQRYNMQRRVEYREKEAAGREVRPYVKAADQSPRHRLDQIAASKARAKANMSEVERQAVRDADAERKRKRRAAAKQALEAGD